MCSGPPPKIPVKPVWASAVSPSEVRKRTKPGRGPRKRRQEAESRKQALVRKLGDARHPIQGSKRRRQRSATRGRQAEFPPNAEFPDVYVHGNPCHHMTFSLRSRADVETVESSSPTFGHRCQHAFAAKGSRQLSAATAALEICSYTYNGEARRNLSVSIAPTCSPD